MKQKDPIELQREKLIHDYEIMCDIIEFLEALPFKKLSDLKEIEAAENKLKSISDELEKLKR